LVAHRPCVPVDAPDERVDVLPQSALAPPPDPLPHRRTPADRRVDECTQELARVGRTGPSDQLLGELPELHRVAHSLALVPERPVFLREDELADRDHEGRAGQHGADHRREQRVDHVAGPEFLNERRIEDCDCDDERGEHPESHATGKD
jgi:hypothetical protein